MMFYLNLLPAQKNGILFGISGKSSLFLPNLPCSLLSWELLRSTIWTKKVW